MKYVYCVKRHESRDEPTGFIIFFVHDGVDMTCKIDYGIRRILSPVVLFFPDETKRQYPKGNTAADAVYDPCYKQRN